MLIRRIYQLLTAANKVEDGYVVQLRRVEAERVPGHELHRAPIYKCHLHIEMLECF